MLDTYTIALIIGLAKLWIKFESIHVYHLGLGFYWREKEKDYIYKQDKYH